VTFEDYVTWANREDVRAEWVDGEIIVMSPATPDHERIALFLGRVLGDYVEAKALGEVFTPILMRLAPRRRGRVPDVLFVAADHADRVGATYLHGPADLAVEIVSPDSVTRDQEKRTEYEAAGVREYWLIEPDEQRATFYQLQDDGRYQPGEIDAEGIYHSLELPGFWLQVEWLWQRPLPPVATIRKLLGI
jgi:Uma2 family endonuclease